MSLVGRVYADQTGCLCDTKGLLISNVAREFAVGLSRLPTKRGCLCDTKGLIISNISRELSARIPHRELPAGAPAAKAFQICLQIQNQTLLLLLYGAFLRLRQYDKHRFYAYGPEPSLANPQSDRHC